MQKVLLYDLKLESYTYHSTPAPSMEGIVIAGYHSAIGDRVTLTDRKVDWRHYDIIYLIADKPGLSYDPEWLGDSRVIPIGANFGKRSQYNTIWERYPLNSRPYIKWAETWKLRYPKYNPERLSHFYVEPHKVMQDGKYVPPKGEVIIIDNDWHKWDPSCTLAATWDVSGARFLYDLEMAGREEEVLTLIEKGTIRRAFLWGHLDYDYYQDPEHREDLVRAWEKSSLGRSFRQRMWVTANSNVGWRQALIFTYKLVADMENRTGKRILLKFYGNPPPKYSRLTVELSRWSSTASSASSNYSFLDYLLFEIARTDKRAGQLLADPEYYVKNNFRGSGKIKEIWDTLGDDPELTNVLATWMGKRGEI